MPTIEGYDVFLRDNFSVPPYKSVSGVPARDTSILYEESPSALKLDGTSASVVLSFPDISSGNTRIWNGFAYNLAAISGGDTDISRIFAVNGAAGVIAFASATNVIYHYLLGGASFPTRAYTLGTWVWIEHILDMGTTTNAAYCRIDDTDLTSVTLAGTASTGRNADLRIDSGASRVARYALHLWGSASSTSDWLSKSEARKYLPQKGIVIPDLSSGGLTKQFDMPFELLGSLASSVLGNIPNTQSISRVYNTISRAPTVADDTSLGYTVGDMWIYNNQVWIATSVAAGTAQWKQVA